MILLIGIFISTVSIFCMVIGDFGWQNLIVGALLTAGVMAIFRKQIMPEPLPPIALSMHLIIYAPVLLYFLLVDILKGTWQVVRTTLGIDPLRHPGIIKISFQGYSDYGVGPIGYFITLSPGSFMVDIDWEERVMLIHVLDATDPDAVRRDAERYLRLWAYIPPKRDIEPELPTPPEDDNE